MLALDRVFCDFCGNFVGQLFPAAAQSLDLVEDKTISPHFCVCPDCFDSSELAELEAA
jgi:hypothetical protein